MKDFILNWLTLITSSLPCCVPDDDFSPLIISINDTELKKEVISKVEECYRRNIETIMQSQPNGVFLNQNGHLIYLTDNFDKISSLEKQSGEDLIKQVLRQAWGKVIDAQCAVGNEKKGPMLLEEAIHRVDLLQEKLRQILPIESSHRVLADEKWAKILANNYKASTNRLIEKMRESQLDQQDPELQKIQFNLEARDKVLQQYREDRKRDYEFIPFTQDEGGINFSGTKRVNKGKETCVISKIGKEKVSWETSSLAWLNEMIGASFDQICGCRFGTAVSALTSDENQELTTLHSFKKSEHWKEEYDAHADLKSSHQFVLFNVLLKTQDAHRKNILCREENGKYIPIPIDLGRLLSYAPHRKIESLLRFTHFIHWSTLDQEFDAETRQFVKNLDPEQVVSAIRHLFVSHPSLEETHLEILERKLTHLRANILMVKEALKENLTPRQLIALATFHLTPATMKQMDDIVNHSKNTDQIDLLMRRYLLKHGYCAFLVAWRAARVRGTFKEEEFVKEIQQSIQTIKKMNVTKEYFNREALKKFDDLYL